MSDRPTSPPPPSPESSDSGWHQPRNPGLWRETRPELEDQGGWRAPQKLAPVETQEGWRVVSASVSVEETPAVVEGETETATAVLAAETAETSEEVLIPHEGSEAAAAGELETAQEPAETVLPFEGSTASDTSLADDISQVAAVAAAQTQDDLDRLDDDEDEDSFSMSELVALASLVDEQPRARLQPAAEAPAAAPVNPDDPAEVARRRLAELRGEVSPSSASSSAEGEEDPASIARRMAQQLAASSPMSPVTPEAPPTPAAPVLSPADQELLTKYQTAETAIRALRSLQRSGQLNRDQMQAELRQHMVRDEKGVWWMMGVESESWYRFENGDWVLAMPRVMELARAQASAASAAPPAPPATIGTPVPALEYLPDEPLPAASATPTFDEGATVRTTPIPAGMESQPLPRAVPIRDPEATIPGMPALDPYASPMSSQATVASAAVDPSLVISTPAPGPGTLADAPPSYDVQGAEAPSFDKAKRAQQQSLLRTVLIVGAVGFAALFALAACGIVGGVLYYQSLAAPWESAVAALANYQPEFRTARILAADGSVIAELNSREGGARDTIPLEEISPYMIHALISTENERYYTDPGWDAVAIGRAFIQNVFAGSIESGASTLTQQIARSLILQDTSVTANRKLQEIIIASMIARQYDKNFILELYLNEFFFGNQSYGIEAASRFYFNKSAADLNMSESAMMAGLLQAPATYDPVVNRQASFDRMTFVLNRMATVGCLQFQHAPYLTQPFCVTRGGGGPSDIASGEVTLQKALIETANYQPRRTTVRYPHFVNYIQQIIEETYGTDAMFRGGYEIRTTLVPRIQDVAQDALFRQVQQLLNNGVQTGAIMVTDPRDGAILSMVGSPDFNNTQFEGQNNFAFLPQQPGSSLKPIVYTAALEGYTDANGQRRYMTPSTIIWDVPTTYGTNPPYSPVNFDRQFHGPQSVRSSLQNSYNVPAVKAYAFIGADVFRDVATRMGLIFQPNASFGLPTALGADDVRLYEMMQAYGTLANDGRRSPLYAITQINDFQGNQIALPQPGAPTQAISPALAFMMQHILSDNQSRAAAFGLNSGLTIPGYADGIVAAKTGTSNDNRDLWTMGFTNNAVVGVWMGRIDNNPTTGTTQTASVPVWNVVMRAALEGRPPEGFSNPGGVVQMQICAATGTMFDPNVNANCPAIGAELFLEGQPPAPANTSFVQTLAIDTWSGQRATTACPEYVETRTFANIDDPFAVQWLNSPQGQAIAGQLGLPTPLEPVPQGECPSQQQPNVRITSPTDGQQVSGTINITGIVTGLDFNRFQLELAPVGQDTFAIISPVTTSQVPSNGTLLQWNTTTVPNGIYRLRLAAFANNGGFIYKIVQIGVNNLAVLPTAPPIALPTAANLTPIPFETPLPLAFPTATLQPAAQVPVFPTATSGLIPLGGLMPLSTATP